MKPDWSCCEFEGKLWIQDNSVWSNLAGHQEGSAIKFFLCRKHGLAKFTKALKTSFESFFLEPSKLLGSESRDLDKSLETLRFKKPTKVKWPALRFQFTGHLWLFRKISIVGYFCGVGFLGGSLVVQFRRILLFGW